MSTVFLELQKDTAVPGRYRFADDELSFRTRLLRISGKEVGVREATGHNDGERVEAFLAYTGLGKGYEWCSAFVCWCYYSAGRSQPRNPWSPALFPRARVIRTYGKATGEIPQPGDVFGTWNSTMKRIAHVGLVEAWGDTYVVTVEGNSGDAVQRRRRVISSIHQVADWVK